MSLLGDCHCHHGCTCSPLFFSASSWQFAALHSQMVHSPCFRAPSLVICLLPVSLPDVARLETKRFSEPGDLRAEAEADRHRTLRSLQLSGHKVLSLGPAAENHNFSTCENHKFKASGSERKFPTATGLLHERHFHLQNKRSLPRAVAPSLLSPSPGCELQRKGRTHSWHHAPLPQTRSACMATPCMNRRALLPSVALHHGRHNAKHVLWKGIVRLQQSLRHGKSPSWHPTISCDALLVRQHPKWPSKRQPASLRFSEGAQCQPRSSQHVRAGSHLWIGVAPEY